MNDIQPDGHGEDAGLMITLGGTVARSELDLVVWAVIVIARGAALAKLGVVEVGVQVSPQPDEAVKRHMPTVKQEVSPTNDRKCRPTMGEEQPEAESIDKDVYEARNGPLILVQSHPIALEGIIAE